MLPEPRVATPDFALPAGRLPYAARRPQVLLHAFVAPEGWDELVERGVLRARAEHALADPIEPYAYEWMARQVRTRLGADETTWPLWCWARTTRRDLTGHARRYMRLAPGTVLVTARVDQQRALLSDYDEWHSALNAQPILDQDLTDDEADAALDAWYDLLDRAVPHRHTRARSTWPEPVLAAMTTTWPAIFDASRWSRRTYVQACVAELRDSDVVDAVRLVRG